MLKRERALRRIRALLKESPVVALLGPRQSGKTTLALEALSERRGERFDLEDPRDQQRLTEPMTALERLRGLVVIDEIQRAPEIFPVLRVLADRRPLPARFLVLGSASPELIRQSSETLAGRIRFMELGGFSIEEVGHDALTKLWTRGGFPRAFLARNDVESFDWREDFIRTFVERDLAALGITVRSPPHMRRLWTMLAHRHAQVLNTAALSAALGESHLTVRRHLDILTGALVVRQLQPWLPNLGKRLVKAPKVFIRDSGVLHALLNIRSFRDLEGHPSLGASWEGFVLETLAQRIGDRELYFWSTHAGAELDILWNRTRGPIGFEVKWSDAPAMTRSMHIALADLALEKLYIVYPGPKRYSLHDRVEVLPARSIDDALQ